MRPRSGTVGAGYCAFLKRAFTVASPETGAPAQRSGALTILAATPCGLARFWLVYSDSKLPPHPTLSPDAGGEGISFCCVPSLAKTVTAHRGPHRVTGSGDRSHVRFVSGVPKNAAKERHFLMGSRGMKTIK
jgi:hypothetical protein